MSPGKFRFGRALESLLHSLITTHTGALSIYDDGFNVFNVR